MNVRTMSFALSSCTVPAKGEPTFSIADGETEFGVGIHGEPGVSRETTVPAQELATRIMDRILSDIQISEGSEVAVLVNGLGGTPLQELYVLFNEVAAILDRRQINIYVSLVGNYMTSLDMAGASVSLLKLDDQLKTLWNDAADTPALKV